ncbi:MAG TPA: 5-(carboxyamino)imidazole ribonucleotide synthase [Gemmatimonadales bacterium]|nr:5-(carboxyamino)imidazole ribonucleotide synthase [Gemmatimonadales bacterium]
MILPGATLGLLGGGQLGRMFTAAARRMGYEVIVLDPDPASPAGGLATRHLRAAYTDLAALTELGRSAAAVTTEFENVPAQSLAFLRQFCPVRPGPEAVAVTQDRVAEKSFVRDRGMLTAAFHPVREESDAEPAFAEVGTPALLKTSRLGYDGKGQALVDSVAGLREAFARFGGQPCILERRLPLDLEISVVLARNTEGHLVTYPVAENHHVNGILDTSLVPARIPDALAQRAQQAAASIARALDYVGTLAVEFFVVGDQLLVNEMAPRPHNSGHYTLDACVTDQFEQQVRAVAGLPLGDTTLLSPVVMVNLLGDLWSGGEPRWERALENPRVKLHLYGKREPRPGRKMGHLNVLAPAPEEALAQALAARERLKSS